MSADRVQHATCGGEASEFSFFSNSIVFIHSTAATYLAGFQANHPVALGLYFDKIHNSVRVTTPACVYLTLLPASAAFVSAPPSTRPLLLVPPPNMAPELTPAIAAESRTTRTTLGSLFIRLLERLCTPPACPDTALNIKVGPWGRTSCSCPSSFHFKNWKTYPRECPYAGARVENGCVWPGIPASMQRTSSQRPQTRFRGGGWGVLSGAAVAAI